MLPAFDELFLIKEYNMIEPKSQILATIENIVKNSKDKIKNAIKVVFSNSNLLFSAFSLGLNPTILNHMCEVVSSILLNYDDSVYSIINSIDFNDMDTNATTLFIFVFSKIYNVLCDSSLDIK